MMSRSLFVACILMLILSACNSEPAPISPSIADEASTSVSSPITPAPSSAANVIEEPPQQTAPPSVPSESTASSKPTESLTKVSPLPQPEEIAWFYAHNAANYTYVGSAGNFIIGDKYSPPLEKCYLEFMALCEGFIVTDVAPTSIGCEFLIWTDNAERHVLRVSDDDYLIVDQKTYQLPEGRGEEIRQLHEKIIVPSEAMFNIEAYPQWLAWMTHSNIEEIIFHSPKRGALTLNSSLIDFVADNITMPVEPAYATTYPLGSVDFSGDDLFHLEIRFKTDVTYHIYAKNAGVQGYDADFYVESSDMSFGCKYRPKMSSIYGAASSMIYDYEFFANAKTVLELYNPAT